MSGHIFNIQDDATLVQMNEQQFENEDIFQTLLEQYPNLLAGDQINSDDPRRWLLVRREMGVPDEKLGSDRWSLDHLFLDQDAVPTLVEVKRSLDTRIRREVVGQMLDYAANAVAHWSIDQVIAAFEKQCETDNVDPEQRLEQFLGVGRDPDEFWRSVKTNLQAGKVRMLFVADSIPPELRRIVEFLNLQMDPAEVLAVEIKHFVGPGLKTLVPRVIGQTAESRKGTASTIRKVPRTEEELQHLADERGVGHVYSALVQQMRPLFDSMSTTRSNVAFYGKIEGVKSGAVLASLTPTESTADQGVAFGMYVDRLAEF
ncbi:MAG: hypothetical protein ABGZ35_23275, partial [Planctomycetaceae bacterium]